MKKISINKRNFVSPLKRIWKNGGLYNIVVYILLIDLAFVFLYPYIFMLATSFKSYNDTIDLTVKWWPKEFTPSNWVTAFNALNFKRTFFNSVFVSLAATLGHIFACSFIAYGFARFSFPFKRLMFVGVLLTIAVPIQSIIIPQYRLYNQLGISDGFLPLILPTILGFGLRGGLFIFLFRQQFLQLPSALEEASEIDGANPFITFFRIVLPSSGSIMLVCFVLSMVWHWNDYYEPSLYLTDNTSYLLPQSLPGMYNIIKSTEIMSENDILLKMTYHVGVAMAGTAMAVLPLLIMFMFLQNKFMESIERTGLVG